MNSKMIIVAGGPLEDEFALARIKGENKYFRNAEQVASGISGVFTVAVDKGLEFFYRHQLRPDFIVGDFDSIKPGVKEYFQQEDKNIPIREFNPVKDASDTEIALHLAVELGAKEVEVLGATGGRLDHFWGNVQSLMVTLREGIDARILDSRNSIRLVGTNAILSDTAAPDEISSNQPAEKGGSVTLKKDEIYGKYFSLFALGGNVKGLSIKGAKYPLENHLLTSEDSLCVSNQIGEGETLATVSFKEGVIILMETRD